MAYIVLVYIVMVYIIIASTVLAFGYAEALSSTP